MSLKENKLYNYIYELLLGEVHGFIGKFYQTFKYKNVKLNKLFQKIEEKGTFHNFFYEVNITLTTKPNKDIHGKEDYWPIFYEHKQKKGPE